MPRCDVRTVDEAADFTPIPDGTVVCCTCDEVNPKKTKNGEDMWGIKWTVVSGEHEGRSFYDNLVFTEAAMNRVKMVAKRVARIDVDAGPFDFEPTHLIGKRAQIEVMIDEYTDKDGKKRRNNKPSYAGYDYYNDGAPDDEKPVQKNTTIKSRGPAGVKPPF